MESFFLTFFKMDENAATFERLHGEVVLDTYGLLCPIPIIKTAEKIKSLAADTLLEVISTDAGIDLDLRNWCKVHRHEYLGCRREGRIYHAFLKVKVKSE